MSSLNSCSLVIYGNVFQNYSNCGPVINGLKWVHLRCVTSFRTGSLLLELLTSIPFTCSGTWYEAAAVVLMAMHLQWHSIWSYEAATVAFIANWQCTSSGTHDNAPAVALMAMHQHWHLIWGGGSGTHGNAPAVVSDMRRRQWHSWQCIWSGIWYEATAVAIMAIQQN